MTTTPSAQEFDANASNLLLAITDLLATDPEDVQWIADLRADIQMSILIMQPDAVLSARLDRLIEIAAAHPRI